MCVIYNPACHTKLVALGLWMWYEFLGCTVKKSRFTVKIRLLHDISSMLICSFDVYLLLLLLSKRTSKLIFILPSKVL